MCMRLQEGFDDLQVQYTATTTKWALSTFVYPKMWILNEKISISDLALLGIMDFWGMGKIVALILSLCFLLQYMYIDAMHTTILSF